MNENSGKGRILGVGSPIMDLLAHVSDPFLEEVPGEKGGMELVDPGQMNAIIARLPEPPHRAPGGSAANTVCALARLGMPVSLLGKMGLDTEADTYKAAFVALGGCTSCFKYMDGGATGRCLSLITPDGQRTMRTDLGAAMHIGIDDVTAVDFDACRHVHIEGYALLNPEFVRHVLQIAKSSGCTVSLDLGSFEVVQGMLALLPGVLRDYVDIVFANEDEARAFCGSDVPEEGLAALGACCPVAAVKMGAEGAWIQAEGERAFAAATPVAKVLDTTGAGDCWAAGFLYGFFKGLTLEESGRLASLIGAETVACLGASPDDAGWRRIFDAALITP